MKVEYINPFVESVDNFFSTMLNCQCKRGDVGVSSSSVPSLEVVALIGLSGPAQGIVSLAFPVATALAIVSRMLGTQLQVMDATVSDGIAEVVNIIAGNAKSKFTLDTPVKLGLPSVIRGNSFNIDYPSKATWLEIPFSSGIGPFVLRVIFKIDGR